MGDKAGPKLIEMLEGEEDRGRAYIERMQKKLLMQAMVCGHYFHKLLERNRQKARHFRDCARALKEEAAKNRRRSVSGRKSSP